MHNRFICEDCGVDTSENNEYYMLKDKLWAKISPEIDNMLCIGCAETRLGRKLNHNDFTDCPVNSGFFPQSKRLLNRIKEL